MSAQRTAIVTGGARGIGAAVAQRLAKDGHTVAVVDRDEEAGKQTAAAIRSEGGAAHSFTADISHEDAVTELVGRVAADVGPPTILVNNAGVVRDNLLHKMSLEDWELVMGVHLRGAFLLSRTCAEHMRSAGWGRILNLSSTSALGNRGQANYATAKAGVQGFTKSLAIELGPFGITVNAIAPGLIVTDMTRATAARVGMPFDEWVGQLAAGIPVGRAGQPEDVAAAASFFVREDSGYVSGQVLYVAGGPKA